jgi:hypothetical protein
VAARKRRKTTVYVDEELLCSAKVLAARTDRKEYEVFEEALRSYLSGEAGGAEGPSRRPDLRELLSGRPGNGRGGWGERPLPGVPDDRAVELPEGKTLSETVVAERAERAY